jgi:hypothetical protein
VTTDPIAVPAWDPDAPTDAARMLRCSRRRVFQLLAAGELERVERLGKHTLVTVESINARLGRKQRSAKRKQRSVSGFRPFSRADLNTDRVLRVV